MQHLFVEHDILRNKFVSATVYFETYQASSFVGLEVLTEVICLLGYNYVYLV
jgi:hypothetical protein